MRFSGRLSAGFPSIWFVIACCQILLVAPAAFAAERENIEITVVQGDTLLGICGTHLAEPRNCRMIARMNKLGNPDLILPGQKLAIPASLLKGTPMEGEVTFLKGKVEVRSRTGKGEWRPLHLNDKVGEETTLRTGAESALEVSFADGSTFFQQADSSLDLVKARSGPWQMIRELFLQVGRAITRVKGATGQEQRFRINTPSAVAAVRGTEFRVAVDGLAATRSEVLQGKVAVEAQAKSVVVAENEGTLVRKGAPPLAPRPLLPPPAPVSPQNTYKYLPLQFSFEPVAGASSYRLQLARDRECRDMLKEEEIPPTGRFQVAALADGEYFLRSLSIDDVGITGIPLEPIAVRVRVNPLAPFIQAPAAAAELREGPVEISWLKVADATGYHLQIATDRDFAKVVEEQADFRDVTFRSGPLRAGAYFFRICSVAGDGYQAGWSDIQSFTVIPPPPVPPLEKPSLDGKEVRIRWHDLGLGFTYHCQLARDSEFKQVLLDQALQKAEITFPLPAEPGAYFVRTAAVDSHGYQGAFSPPQSFEVKRRFPYAAFGLLVPIGVLLLLVL